MWYTLRGASQNSHTGGGYPLNKNPWVNDVCLTRSLVTMTSSLLDFRIKEGHRDTPSLIERSLFRAGVEAHCSCQTQGDPSLFYHIWACELSRREAPYDARHDNLRIGHRREVFSARYPVIVIPKALLLRYYNRRTFTQELKAVVSNNRPRKAVLVAKGRQRRGQKSLSRTERQGKGRKDSERITSTSSQIFDTPPVTSADPFKTLNIQAGLVRGSPYPVVHLAQERLHYSKILRYYTVEPEVMAGFLGLGTAHLAPHYPLVGVETHAKNCWFPGTNDSSTQLLYLLDVFRCPSDYLTVTADLQSLDDPGMMVCDVVEGSPTLWSTLRKKGFTIPRSFITILLPGLSLDRCLNPVCLGSTLPPSFCLCLGTSGCDSCLFLLRITSKPSTLCSLALKSSRDL
uniref:Uncharacterized protein n=1 Tax=Timema tahoe TaxID=61484 RepID=A0A7R9P0P5_9NEOP|nr:unnamed protein product [Timema tahoe]